MSTFDNLPYEKKFQILLDVGYPGLINYCRTNKTSRELCDDDFFWKSLYIKDFRNIPRKSENAKNDYLNVYRKIRQFSDDVTKKHSQINKRYLLPGVIKAQTDDIFQLIVDFIDDLDEDNNYIEDFKGWANLDPTIEYGINPVETDYYDQVTTAVSDYGISIAFAEILFGLQGELFNELQIFHRAENWSERLILPDFLGLLKELFQ